MNIFPAQGSSPQPQSSTEGNKPATTSRPPTKNSAIAPNLTKLSYLQCLLNTSGGRREGNTVLYNIITRTSILNYTYTPPKYRQYSKHIQLRIVK